MKEKIEKIILQTNFINYICILMVAVILAIPIFSKNLDVYFDDGVQHIARAFGTIQSFKEQGLFPNIISSFTNNFGYSWNLFYGPLSTYGIILINFIFKSLVTSYKIWAFICFALSGIFMYKFLISMTKNSNTALLGAIIYLTFPYHLTDWYIRNALGEFMSFMFVPLVFLGLYQLFNTTENHYYLTFGAAGLILTHNLCTIITCIFAFVYVLIHFKNLKETHVKKGLLINFIFIITITSFFWAPMLEAKFSSNYQVYEENAMSTKESVESYALDINQLFVTKDDDVFVFELGIHVIIMLCFSIMSFKRLKENLKKQYIFCFVCAFICVIMSTKIWPWRLMPEVLTIIQFPWRMLLMAGFFLSIVCCINMSVTLKEFKSIDVIIISIICIVYTCALNNYVPYSNIVPNIQQYNLGMMSGKNYEVVAGTGKAEYLPKRAFDNRFYIATREDAIYVLEGKAIIENEEKNGTNYKANIQTVEEKTTFELPYIYYPGYQVCADGMIIDTFETGNGFLGIKLEPNENIELEVKYTGTKIMKISLLFSIIGTIVFLVYVWKKH